MFSFSYKDAKIFHFSSFPKFLLLRKWNMKVLWWGNLLAQDHVSHYFPNFNNQSDNQLLKNFVPVVLSPALNNQTVEMFINLND